MKILVISAYYSPDLSAGSFRTTALADALSKEDIVEVVTAKPHRYASHAVDAEDVEICGNVTIKRIAVPPHNGSMISQIRSYSQYFFGTLRHVRGKDYDVVFATSSRLLTGFLGSVVSIWKGRPLYLDIRDIFVDTLKSVLSKRVFMLIRPIATVLEQITVRRATTVNLVSQGFEGYFRERYPNKRYSFLTNGIDDFAMAGLPARLAPADGIATILYAGNLGEGQGIESILPPAAKALEGRARFIIFGDGARRTAIERRCSELGVENILINKPVPREDLLRAYADADALFVHLNAYEAFLKVLPSKIFEYGALGRPILAGVAGYPAAFLREHLPDALVFEPQDVEGLVAAVTRLRAGLAPADRRSFLERFNRQAISEELAKGIRAIKQHPEAKL
jgi:glycosyltransferase involved in cell wall biosynthesis